MSEKSSQSQSKGKEPVSDNDKHYILKTWPYPDGSHTWVCACGVMGTPSTDIEFLNQESYQHVKGGETNAG